MKWIDYREKLGIGFNDSEKFKMLSNILQNYVERVIGGSYTRDSYLNYCQMVGEHYYDYKNSYQHLRDSLGNCKSITDIIAHFIAFYNTYIPERNGYSYRTISKNEVIEYFIKTLKNINVNYEVLEDDDGVLFFLKVPKN